MQSRDLILPQFLVSGTTPSLQLECSTRESGVEGNYLVSYSIGPSYVKNQKDVGFFQLRRGFQTTHYNITYNHSDLGVTVGSLLGNEKFNLSWSYGPANVNNTRVMGSFLTLTTVGMLSDFTIIARDTVAGTVDHDTNSTSGFEVMGLLHWFGFF